MNNELDAFKRLMTCHTQEYVVGYQEKDTKLVESGLKRLGEYEKPREYIKWENLTFDKKRKTLFVTINSSIYTLEYGKEALFKKGKKEPFAILYKIREPNYLVYFREETKQLFNDLKMEVIKR